MRGNTLVAAAPRQALLEELRGRLTARVAAVENRLLLLKGESENLALARIGLLAERQVLEEQMQECRRNED